MRAVVQVQAELGQSAVSANTPLVRRLRAAAAEPSAANMPALLEELLVTLGVVPGLAASVAEVAADAGAGEDRHVGGGVDPPSTEGAAQVGALPVPFDTSDAAADPTRTALCRCRII